jgi:chitin synthase
VRFAPQPNRDVDSVHLRGARMQFLVVIIVDGREKMSKSVAEFAEKELKVWDSSMLKYEHRNNEVTCHIFEKTVDLPKHSSQREYYKPLQIVMAVKEKNGGKLNSHLWYFSAFAKQLQPDYVFVRVEWQSLCHEIALNVRFALWLQLLDVGTCPRPGALWMLFDAMQKNPQVGGVCGEIAVRNPRIYNLIEASQHFEYKVSHVMDKGARSCCAVCLRSPQFTVCGSPMGRCVWVSAMESVFGYVSVLPGAFSAYRWKAVRGEPLNSYFFVEENSVKEMGPFLANMYLAEDRVLCFELLAKENRTWTLHFVTGAVAETDVPETLLELLKQRRRWLNGSFFSLVYFVSKFHHLLSRSDHSWFRRLGLVVQFFYQLSSLIMSWFAVGSLYLSLVVIFNLALERLGNEASTQIMWVFSLSYGFLTFIQLMLGLGSKPHEVIKIYFMCSLGYGLIMSFASALSAWHLASGAYVAVA